MDSCHFFNFLFGTKKMTTELSKCFSSLSTPATRRSKGSFGGSGESKSSREDTGENSKHIKHPAPQSPLKQLQRRLAASLGNSAAPKNVDDYKKKSLRASCDSNCGTYRATLIDSLTDEDECTNVNPDIAFNEAEASKISADDYDEVTGDDIRIVAEINQLRHNKVSLVLMEPVQAQPSRSHCEKDDFRAQTSEEHHQSSEKSRSEATDTNNQMPINKRSQSTKCRRVVLYSDSDLSQEEGQVVASSAEIYNIVSDSRVTQTKLNGVDSLSNRYTQNIFNNNQDRDNNYNDRGDSFNVDHLKQVVTTNKAEVYDKSRDKRNVYVRSLVQSIESNNSFEATVMPTSRSPSIDYNNNISVTGSTKPMTFVKPLPPPTPPKTMRAKFLNMQINLNKPTKIQQLFQDETFLRNFFHHLDPLDRCAAAQVCRSWRNILYSNHEYWKDLVMIVDCIQMRREHLVDCILSTLQTAKLKQNQKTVNSGSDTLSRPIRGVKYYGARSEQPYTSFEWLQQPNLSPLGRGPDNQSESSSIFESIFDKKQYNSFAYDMDLEDVWRIQELCNRYTQRSTGDHSVSGHQLQNDNNGTGQQQSVEQKQVCTTSKSCSIPSQISSTLSSVSLSSLLSPLSESSRIEFLKEKLYLSLDARGFDSLCLFGATNEDIEDLINKIPQKAHRRFTLSRLLNCSITNSGLEQFMIAFDQLEELELSGCNEITNTFELRPLTKLKRLIITDCINIADGVAHKLAQTLDQLDELTIQAYHLTDVFLEYLSQNADTSKLRRLELPNCKEITNQSLITIAKDFSQLDALSISGSTKISDEGIEILSEQVRQLKLLDLSWCSRISDASLECIACDLGETLTDLILDRNIHITDVGLGYLATMGKLKLLHIRWCPRITDAGLESIIAQKSLRYLSLAGLHQITARSLLCLIDSNLLEVELTNCPAVNNELALFLSSKMPNCNIIF